MNNEEIVQKMIDDIWIAHNPNACKNYFSENVVIHGPHNDIKGCNEFISFIEDLFQAFPDLEYHVEDVISGGDKVAVRWQGKGTHKGNFINNPATNRKITYQGMSFYLIEKNKIKECWVTADLYGLLKQLGILHAQK